MKTTLMQLLPGLPAANSVYTLTWVDDLLGDAMLILPLVLLILSIVLFIWLMRRDRFFTPRLLLPCGLLAIPGGFFLAVGISLEHTNFDEIEDPMEIAGALAVKIFAGVLELIGIGFLALIPILLLIFALLHRHRMKKQALDQ